MAALWDCGLPEIDVADSDGPIDLSSKNAIKVFLEKTEQALRTDETLNEDDQAQLGELLKKPRSSTL